jgi:D-alanine-D-alanine ligase
MTMKPTGLPYIPIVHGATDGRPDEADTLEAAEAISETLRGLGFASDLVHVGLDFTPIEDMARRKPLAVFNLVEAIQTDLRLQPFVPALLDRLRLPYTGSGFDALVAAMSKVRCKHLLKAASVATPAWVDGIRNPLPDDTLVLVKSDSEHASVGIDSSSVVPAVRAQDLIAARERTFGGKFFAEVFIEGREFNVAMLAGPNGPEVLPIPEIVFVDYPDDKPRIVDYDAKWAADSFAYNNTPRDFGIEKSDARLARKLKRMALDCWRVFGLAGYARVDFRVDAMGKPWVIDVNTNPCITPDAGFAATASRAGISYPEVIQRIVQAALPATKDAVRTSEPGELARAGAPPQSLADAW